MMDTDIKDLVVKFVADALDSDGAIVFLPDELDGPDAPDLLVEIPAADELFAIRIERQPVESVA